MHKRDDWIEYRNPIEFKRPEDCPEALINLIGINSLKSHFTIGGNEDFPIPECYLMTSNDQIVLRADILCGPEFQGSLGALEVIFRDEDNRNLGTLKQSKESEFKLTVELENKPEPSSCFEFEHNEKCKNITQLAEIQVMAEKITDDGKISCNINDDNKISRDLRIEFHFTKTNKNLNVKILLYKDVSKVESDEEALITVIEKEYGNFEISAKPEVCENLKIIAIALVIWTVWFGKNRIGKIKY